MSHISGEVLVVGFGTGAALALLLAADKPAGLAAVVSVAAPIRFRARSLRFAPVLDRINKLSQWVYIQDGVKPFQIGEPEHPDIEYRNMPVRGLMELRKIADSLDRRLPEITCPVSVFHATNDPVVDPASATIIHERIGSVDKRLHFITSDRHGILHENIENTQDIVIARLSEFVVPQRTQDVMPPSFLPRVGANLRHMLPPYFRGRLTSES
jgi:pimeloyl-ACP methyl ester carboxylesterase